MKKEQEAILKQIETYWGKYSSMRFGQVLQSLQINQPETMRLGMKEIAVYIRDNFYDTDEQILQRIKEQTKK